MRGTLGMLILLWFGYLGHGLRGRDVHATYYRLKARVAMIFPPSTMV